MGNRIAAGLLLVALSIRAQSLGTFTEVGSLTTVRTEHTATLLTNGKVLIAGGYATLGGWPVWSSAELYDPGTLSFTATGSMTAPRVGHTSTLLPDGQVLITGGVAGLTNGAGGPPQASAELYDPSTGTFTPTGSMTTARCWHTATLLNNGQVLITGGFGADAEGNEPALSSAELYDPLAGTFSAAGNMITTQGENLAVLLTNGQVLLQAIGDGCGATGNPELYDPTTGVFRLTGTPAYPLYPMTANLLPNGNVLTTMNVPCDIGRGAEIYNTGTGTFSATTNLPSDIESATATFLSEGKVFLHWEQIGYMDYQAGGSSVLFDPVAATFTEVPGGFPQSDQAGTSTLLADGTVLLAGGWICCGFSVADAEIYAPADLTSKSPVLFSLSGGTQGAILHGATQQVVSASNPAAAGEAIEIYGAGLIEGSVIPPQVSIGGRMAQVLFFGDAPGYPGLNQFNVVVPGGIASGAAAPVRIFYLTRPSNEVTLAVQ